MQEVKVLKQCCDIKGRVGNPKLDNPEHEHSENPSPGILLFTRGVTVFEALHAELGEKFPFLEKAAAVSSINPGRRQELSNSPDVLERQSHF